MINVNDSYTNEITEQYKNLVNPYEILFTTKQRQFYSLKLNISAIICKILSCLSFFQILESSQTLLNVLKKESQTLREKTVPGQRAVQS